eukprot:59376_1
MNKLRLSDTNHIDGVVDSKCLDYDNWMKTTKQKLQERECQLFPIRKNQIEHTVNKALSIQHGDIQPMFVLSQNISNNTLNALTNAIKQWNGVQLKRVKVPPTSFASYYLKGKTYWDSMCKCKIFGSLFWPSVLRQIHQFVHMDRGKLLVILISLLDATVKYYRTKALPLISGSALVLSNELHQYFFKLDHSLRINQSSAKDLRRNIRSHLCLQLENVHRRDDIQQQARQSTTLSPVLYNGHGICPTIPTMRDCDYVGMNSNSYGGYRGNTLRRNPFEALRHSPLVPMPTQLYQSSNHNNSNPMLSNISPDRNGISILIIQLK